MRIGFAALLVALLAVLAPAVAAAPPVLAKGSFGPTAKYTGKGTATVVRVGAARELRLSRDFVAMNAIKLRLYLATSPAATGRVDLGPMRPTGAQRFRLPASANLKRHRYVIAWCVAVNEPITQAVLR
jgi:hypothetical protein